VTVVSSRPQVARTEPAAERLVDAPDPARHLLRWRLTQVAIGLAVCALPLLRPSGPGNTGAVDVALLGGMFAAAIWASTRSLRVRLPYALPVAVTVLGGALAVAIAPAGTGAGGRGGLALVQDIFVFGWAAAVATIGRDRKLLDTFCRVWAYSATGWAAILIFGELAGITWLTGINSADGLRASLTFGDPNLAADYFLCGLLVIRAIRRPRRSRWRWLCCGLVVTAIVLTLSNGGLLAMLIATILGALFTVARRRGMITALTVGVLLSFGGLVLVETVDVHNWIVDAEQSSPLVRDSLGREAESGGSRTVIAAESIKLLVRDDTVFGVGPANTETTLRKDQAPYVKEAHDDYLAILLERGVLGGVALILLIVAAAVRCRRIAKVGGVAPDYLEIVPRPELLVAAVVAVAVSALFYEVLHFRHVWALLGLVAALEQSRRVGRRS
jgi:O-antigen ligase